jgi:hypothetical protein
VPKVARVSGLSILNCPFGFLLKGKWEMLRTRNKNATLHGSKKELLLIILLGAVMLTIGKATFLYRIYHFPFTF